uniref:predicted GPI-anchored protein 58 isoform X3 n=1 Tax=Gasterosteus aculeatus aculeatus TaxID=481459 RepID=UPI001A97DE4B|nr:predicted GPI-anchored protein 58 isoform X3 [Gasterosteus aculeatus aculeatus]
MSYLWILLLGSLLAAGAKAQEDAAPEEDAEAPEGGDAPDEPAADVNTDNSSPEIPTSASDSEPEETSTAEEAEAVPSPVADQEVEAEGEVPTENAVPAPQGPAADPEPEAEAEATTPQGPAADPDPEAEAATTPQGPAADDDVIDPTTEEKGATLAPEIGAEADPTVEDDEEKPTVPPAVVKKVDPELEVMVPETEVVAEKKTEKDGRSKGRMGVFSEPPVSGASGEDKPEHKEASSGSLAAILSAVGVSVVGAIVGYFTYQQKKLCFKNRQEADPEAARKADTTEAQSDPQVLSNLLNSS